MYLNNKYERIGSMNAISHNAQNHIAFISLKKMCSEKS
jgi:hypothetical protein